MMKLTINGFRKSQDKFNFSNVKMFFLTGMFSFLLVPLQATVHRFVSDGYLKAVEMNNGDTLVYRLKSDEERTFILKNTSAKPLFIYNNPNNQWHSGIVYAMYCRFDADGQELELQRIVSAQQSYYEPWHINGITIFFDAVNAIDSFIQDSHGSTGGEAYPRKDARFAFVEYEGNFASQDLMPWYPNADNYISVKDAYNGGDTWLGGFKKQEAHNGMDVNIPNNIPLWAPINFDDQYYFNSIEKGDNNNRWMGVRNWSNGEKWILRTHHMTDLKVEQHTSLKQGQLYGTVGGVRFGNYPHIHFYFIWSNNLTSMALDPWMLFWKIFETNKKRAGEIRAVMHAFNPQKVGEKVLFDASRSTTGILGPNPVFSWSVSDGAFYEGKKAEHIFRQEGVYTVTLLVSNGTETATVTQHITINKGDSPRDFLTLRTDDVFDFRTRTLGETDTYGAKPETTGNYLNFFFRKNAAYQPNPKKVVLQGSEAVLKSLEIKVEYLDYSDWLRIERKQDTLQVSMNKDKLPNAWGKYQAKVIVTSASTGHSQAFLVVAKQNDHRILPADTIVVDNQDVLYYPSRFYWVKEPYDKKYLKGYGDLTFWAGKEDEEGIVRYQPELKPGKYRISMHEKALAEPGFSEIAAVSLHVQVKTTRGISDLIWKHKENRELGEFDLLGGKDTYLDILTKGSKGQVYIDALVFERIEE